AAGHVFAAVVAGALDDGDRSGVAHRKALARDTAEIALALDGAVENRVADDDRLFRHDAAFFRWPADDAAAREAPPDIVVAFAFEIEGDAARKPGAEALAGGALQPHMDSVCRKTGMTVALRYFAGE